MGLSAWEKCDGKTERIRVCFYKVDLGRNSLKEDGIFGEDIKIVQPKSFHQRGSAHVNLTVLPLQVQYNHLSWKYIKKKL